MKELTKEAITGFCQGLAAMMKQVANKQGKLCKYYYDVVREHPAMELEFRKAFPAVAAGTWRNWYRVGAGIMDVRLLTFEGVAHYILARMPIAAQTRLLDKPVVDFVPADAKSPEDYVRVPLADLLPEAVRQVFTSEGHMRTPLEQLAHIRRTASAPAAPTTAGNAVPVSVVRRGKTWWVVADRAFEMPLADMKRLLAV